VTLLASIAIGGLAAAALAVNNHRDMEHDRLVGRRTFAVVFGAGGSRHLYSALLLGPFLIVPVMAVYAEAPTLLLGRVAQGSFTPTPSENRTGTSRFIRLLSSNRALKAPMSKQIWVPALRPV
jgi:1,4-dihydroxy-2-naphthoate octaprenyltransferase